jgi:hypothetical protein
MVLYQILLTSNSQTVDLQLTGGRYKIRIVGINYTTGAGTHKFNLQFQAPMFMMKGSRINVNSQATPIAYLTYSNPTTDGQITNDLVFVADYFGSFQLEIFDLSTNALVTGTHFESCLLNLDITPFNPNKDHLE